MALGLSSVLCTPAYQQQGSSDLWFLLNIYYTRTLLFQVLENLVQSIITVRKRSLGQGNIFTPLCHSVHRGGACMVAPGGGGMCGCSQGGVWLLPGGACVVAPGGAWLLQGHVRLLLGGGACMVAPGGACVVAPGGGGHAWLLPGGAWGTTRYGDTINERVVRILLECILVRHERGFSLKMMMLSSGISCKQSTFT